MSPTICPQMPDPREATVPSAAPESGGLRFHPVGRSMRKRLREHLGFDGNVILALGRIADACHYERIIAAFALVVRRDPLARLHLAIEHPAAAFCERELLRFLRRRAGQSEARSRITFAPIPEPDRRADLYHAADLFVSAHAGPAQCGHVREAMACGLPALLPDSLSEKDGVVFGRHALTADPDDVLDYAVTMMKIFRDPELRTRIARMGSHYVRSLLAWSGLASRSNEFSASPAELAHRSQTALA